MSHILATFAAIFIALFLATIYVKVISTKRPEKDYTELGQRIKSWWIMVAMFASALLFNKTLALIFFAFISYLALKEYLTVIPTRQSDRRVLFWAYLSIPLQYYWIGMDYRGFFLVFIPVYMFLILPLRMMMTGATRGFLVATGTIHWGLMTTVFGLSHLAYLFVLSSTGDVKINGAGLVLYLVLLTQGNDVFQYIWGKSIGKRKIVPAISPNKTWEGFLGGVATTTLVSVLLAPWLTPLNLVLSICAGVLLGTAGFVGDVVVSAIKRDLGIKDFSSLIPGHGGILDRIDSLTYTAPLFFHFIYWFYF